MKIKKIYVYVIAILVTLGVGALSGYLTMGAMEEFMQLNQPPLSPPPIVFPIVWTILYILMAISISIVLTNENATKDTKFLALAFYGLNLAFNFLWPIWFFVFGLLWFSVLWLVLLIAIVLVLMLISASVSRVSMYLLIPYILWLLFALYLNIGVAFLN